MQTATLDVLKHQLEDRKVRLEEAMSRVGPEEDLVRLLQQVDAALGRLGSEDYGRCLVCEEHVDDKDLLANPLLPYCLCDLSADQQRALEHDLGLAWRIQSALLPNPDARSPHWDANYRYEPAGPVSGDYCDLWTRPGEDGFLYFAVGDVSGKGVAASLLMAHLHAFFHSQPEGKSELGALVQRANRLLLESTLPTHYATLVLGRARSDGAVEIVNAGHCPPLVWRGESLQVIPSTGFPIGLLEDKPFEVSRLTLAHGDAMVLYTDGLTEARRADGVEYGAERVASVLQDFGRADARHLVRRLREDLSEFLAGAPRSDDLTLLALRRA
jgi:sigma-B regulation protein RsbU (phosphoserine phosphatase)